MSSVRAFSGPQIPANIELDIRNCQKTMPSSIEQILSSYDDRAPLAQASTIPAPWYVDARIAELEGLTVFGKTWQLVARTDQLKAPGEFVATIVAGGLNLEQLQLRRDVLRRRQLIRGCAGSLT